MSAHRAMGRVVASAAILLVGCPPRVVGPPPGPVAATAGGEASAAVRVIVLPRRYGGESVVEFEGDTARVVAFGQRAELRGDDITWAPVAYHQDVMNIARDGALWVFRFADGEVATSDTFLGPLSRAATPAGGLLAPPDAPIAVSRGPAVFLDRAGTPWRLDAGAMVPVETAVPVRAHAVHFTTARDGAMAVDGPVWYVTHDGGRVWSPARPTASCARSRDPVGRVVPVAPSPGEPSLSCAPDPLARLPTLLGSDRPRVLLSLVAREPAYLALAWPVALGDGTLAAAARDAVVYFDATTWRPVRRTPLAADFVQTSWRRGGDVVVAAWSGRWAEYVVVRSDGSTVHEAPRPEYGALVAERMGGTSDTGADPAALVCRGTWRTDEAPPRDLGRPCANASALLFGDDLVEVVGGARVEAWRVPVVGADSPAPRPLFAADRVDTLHATSGGRWLYAVAHAPEATLAWGDPVGPWRRVALPAGCDDALMVTPERLLAWCAARRVVLRSGDGGARWEPLPLGERARSLLASGWDPVHASCSVTACVLSPSVVLAAPWGPLTRPAEDAPAASPPRASYTCQRAGALALPAGGGATTAGRWWAYGDAGYVTSAARVDAAGRARTSLAWVGVDAGGVFLRRSRAAAIEGFEVVGEVARVERDGVALTGSLGLGEIHLGPLWVTRRFGADGSAGAPIVYDGNPGWLDAECPMPAGPTAGAAISRLHAAEAEATRQAPRGFEEATWEFVRARDCGRAWVPPGGASVALHVLHPSPQAAPVAAPRPAFEAARPCVGAPTPEAVRWRVSVRGDWDGLTIARPWYGGQRSLAAQYESVGREACLRGVVADQGTLWLAAQPDGTLDGFERADGAFVRVRCHGP